MTPRLLAGLTAAVIGLGAAPAWAQIKIGAILSISGPAAAMGVGYKGAFELFPKEIDGKSVTYIVRDDGTDPNNAFTIAQKMISEDHVDAFIGPSLTSSDAAVQPLANSAHVPMIAMAPLDYDPRKDPYTFSDAQPVSLIIDAVFGYLQRHGVKTVGYIGFADGFGDQVYEATKQSAAKAGMKLVADERYARTDTSVDAQVLKLISSHPDAVVMGNSATPAALPVIGLRRHGYKGLIAGNHGIVSPAIIRVGGSAAEGVIAATGPVVVYNQLPANNPVQPVANSFMSAYVKLFGADSVNPFAGYSYDAMLLLRHAIPIALEKGQPGTPAFREALRDALEQTKELVGTHGVYTMSPTNHNGQDQRAAVLVQIQNGEWKLIH